MLYYVMKMLSKLVCLLPYKIINYIGDIIGGLTWYLVPKKRKQMAKQNIMLALDKNEVTAEIIAKKSWTRFGAMIMEVLYFPKIKQDINKYVEIQGREHLDEALKQGKGIVLATAHSSNWELLGGGLALNGYQIVGVAQKQTNGSMDKFINEYRRVIGMDIAYKNSVRDMVRFLGEKKIVGLLMDQDADKNGVIVNFFGRKASTPQGPAVLARMSGSPIVPMFITKRSDGLYKIIIHKHIDAQNTADKKNDILNDITNLTKIIENHIRIYPKEWFWLHNRWQVKD